MEFLSQLRELVNMYIPLKRDPAMSSTLHAWMSKGYPRVSLDAAGLVALADLSTIARRTALTGTSALLDTLIICPGLHKQQTAPELNGGEYPACAAMTSGFVFRVENQAMVLHLQTVGRTGQLTCVSVVDQSAQRKTWQRHLCKMFYYGGANLVIATAYSTAVILTLTVLLLLIFLKDWWGFTVVGILVLARLINVIIIRRRAAMGWKGQSEPGKQSDLIILLSQDRWIRMRGAVDDVKAVTSGEWLREPTFMESSAVALSTLLVYLDAALAGNASKEGKVLLLILLFCSVGLLGLVNEYTKVFKMYGKVIKVDGPRKSYGRRLELAEQLIEESGRKDWAVRLGMVQPGFQTSSVKKEEIKTQASSSREDRPENGDEPTVTDDGSVIM